MRCGETNEHEFRLLVCCINKLHVWSEIAIVYIVIVT